MAKRKYVFDEFDRTGFQEALDTMMTNRACYNNFVSYLQQLYEKENNSELKKKYEKKLKALDRRGPEKYLTHREIALIVQRDNTNVENWLKKSPPPLPDISVLPVLSKAFGVSTDCLLGLVTLPEFDRGEFDALTELGFDTDLLQRKYNQLCNEQEDFIYVLRALELLFKSSSSFSILSNIGKYLTGNDFQWGLLYAGDSLIKLIHQIIDEYPDDNLDEYIGKKLSEGALSKTKLFTDLAIENIMSELKKYKEELKSMETNM